MNHNPSICDTPEPTRRNRTRFHDEFTRIESAE